jgi:hypothetical protein
VEWIHPYQLIMKSKEKKPHPFIQISPFPFAATNGCFQTQQSEGLDMMDLDCLVKIIKKCHCYGW